MTHIFTLVLKRPRALHKAYEIALREAGCGDAVITQEARRVELEFIRQGLHFDELLDKTLQALTGIDGIEVSEVNLNAQF